MDPDRTAVQRSKEAFLKKHNIPIENGKYNDVVWLIYHLNNINKKLVYKFLKKFYGLDLKLKFEKVTTFCQQRNPYPILGRTYDSETWKNINLSVCSEDLGSNDNFLTIESFSRTIDRLKGDAKVAYGGYGEPRPFYSTSQYEFHTKEGKQWRTVHLGVDIWAKAGSKIYAPFDGEVYACSRHIHDGDYGHVLIQKVKMDHESHFYILYGHLSSDIIENYNVGDSIIKGEFLAELGSQEENGGWTPHLHLQIVCDLLSHSDNFFGVAIAEDWKIWRRLCPDPTKLLNIVENDEPTQVMKNIQYEQMVVADKSYNIVLICRAYKQILYSLNGQQYLNCGFNSDYLHRENTKLMNDAWNYYQFTQMEDMPNRVQEHTDEILNIINHSDVLKGKIKENRLIVSLKNRPKLNELYDFFQQKSILVSNVKRHELKLEIYFHRDLDDENFSHIKNVMRNYLNSQTS